MGKSLDEIKATIAALKQKAAEKQASQPKVQRTSGSKVKGKGYKAWHGGLTDPEWEEFKAWRKSRR